MSIYTQEEHCTWVVSSVLGKLCPRCWFNPDLKIFADLTMSITGMMIYIIILIFVFKKLNNFSSFMDMVQERGHMLALSCFCITTGCDRTHNHEMAQSSVTSALPFCRNQPIWCMSRVWQQPSQVGKAYNWFQWWNFLVSSELVSDHPDVTVATLCRVFILSKAWFSVALGCQNCSDTPHFLWVRDFFVLPHCRIFPILWVLCCLNWVVTTVVTLPFLTERSSFSIWPHFGIFSSLVGVLSCFQISYLVCKGSKNNWITAIQFHFWVLSRFI
jgi:hypothetical protein